MSKDQHIASILNSPTESLIYVYDKNYNLVGFYSVAKQPFFKLYKVWRENGLLHKVMS